MKQSGEQVEQMLMLKVASVKFESFPWKSWFGSQSALNVSLVSSFPRKARLILIAIFEKCYRSLSNTAMLCLVAIGPFNRMVPPHTRIQRHNHGVWSTFPASLTRTIGHRTVPISVHWSTFSQWDWTCRKWYSTWCCFWKLLRLDESFVSYVSQQWSVSLEIKSMRFVATLTLSPSAPDRGLKRNNVESFKGSISVYSLMCSIID